jgi:hypothetical protein
MRRTLAVLLLLASGSTLLTTGCGKEPVADLLETPQYHEWRGSQAVRQLPVHAGGISVPGRIEVQPAERRLKHPGDFCEVYLNGHRIGRYGVARLPDGSLPRINLDVEFNSGPNTFDVWDTTTNRYYRQSVDTRNCTHFVLAPSADGYDIQQIGAKIRDD